MPRILLTLAVLLVALGALVVGMGRDPAASRPDVVLLNRGDVSTIDPQAMSWMADIRVGRAVFQGLVRIDPFTADGRVAPAMAERWDVSDDRLTYTFHLRDGLRWSNGQPLLASDFIYAWRRAVLPELASDYTRLLRHIRGTTEFLEWRRAALAAFDPTKDSADALWKQTLERFDALVQARAIDSRTLRVRLVRPLPYFLDLLALPVFYPVYPALLDRYESPDPQTGQIRSTSGWTRPGEIVCNGPFVLSVWRFKRDMRLDRNPFYWDAPNVSVSSILMPTVDDANASVLAFNAGAADWVTDVTPAYRGDMFEAKQACYREHDAQVRAWRVEGLDPVEIDRRLPRDPRLNIHAFPSFGTYFYNFNCRPVLPDGRPNPLADARVRRALAMCVDKARIVDQIRRIGEPAAAALIPPGSIGGYKSPAGLSFDPVGAAKLLAEAGYPKGLGLPPLEILFNRDGGHDIVAQAIARDWEQLLGVRVVLLQKEVRVFRQDVRAGNFMISRASWWGDYPDPTTFLEVNRTGDGNNDRGYSSARYDALLEQAEAETDPGRRLELLSQAEAILVEQDLPLIPIHHYSVVHLFDAHRLSGVSSHPRQDQDLSLLDVLGDGRGADVPRSIPPSIQPAQTRRANPGGARSNGGTGAAP